MGTQKLVGGGDEVCTKGERHGPLEGLYRKEVPSEDVKTCQGSGEDGDGTILEGNNKVSWDP